MPTCSISQSPPHADARLPNSTPLVLISNRFVRPATSRRKNPAKTKSENQTASPMSRPLRDMGFLLRDRHSRGNEDVRSWTYPTAANGLLPCGQIAVQDAFQLVDFSTKHLPQLAFFWYRKLRKRRASSDERAMGSQSLRRRNNSAQSLPFRPLREPQRTARQVIVTRLRQRIRSEHVLTVSGFEPYPRRSNEIDQLVEV